jgi:hypothetical protein
MAQAVEPIAEGPGGRRPNGEPRQKGELEPLAVTAERVQTAERPKEAAVYPGRFMLGYLMIVLFFGALIVAAAVVWSHQSSDSTSADDTNWSFFRPTADSEAQRTREIARFVGTRYQTDRGRQLVRVLGGPPAVQDAPVVQFMVRDPVGGTKEETIGADKAIMFILCGTGTDCALPANASSDADLRLVRREALELALYMMKYNDVDPVVVLLPPGAGGDPGGALLFRRKDLESHLDQPLSRTLAVDKPPTATGFTDLETATVDYLTLTRKFAYTFQSLQGGLARMLLNPERPTQ